MAKLSGKSDTDKTNTDKYPCIPACGRRFPTSSALGYHRRYCQAIKEASEKTVKRLVRNRELSEAQKALESQAKRRRVDSDSEPGATGILTDPPVPPLQTVTCDGDGALEPFDVEWGASGTSHDENAAIQVADAASAPPSNSESPGPPSPSQLEVPPSNEHVPAIQPTAELVADEQPQEFGRGLRKKSKNSIPWKYRDLLPEPLTALPSTSDSLAAQEEVTHAVDNTNAAKSPEISDSGGTDSDVGADLSAQKLFRTIPNSFGIYREYPYEPSFNPDQYLEAHEFLDEPEHESNEDLDADTALAAPSQFDGLDNEEPDLGDEPEKSPDPSQPWYHPYENASTFALMEWMNNGNTAKSQAEVQKLIDEVILSNEFKVEHFSDFNIRREMHRLDDDADLPAPLRHSRWKKTSVRIPVPDGQKHKSLDDVPHFEVSGIYYRPLLDVLKEAHTSSLASGFHYTPFREYWRDPSKNDTQHENEHDPGLSESPTGSDEGNATGSHSSGQDEQIFGEAYTSERWRKEQEFIDSLPREEGDDLERAISGFMFWSDATQLVRFSNTSFWPGYMFFGNQSKYDRAKPSSRGCFHFVYIQKLPEEFLQFYSDLTGKRPGPDKLAHCRRELIHAILHVLFSDPEFLKAYREGIIVKCWDGIMRRLFPRLITYSADYPERVLLASIKFLGRCPCPRCLVTLAKAQELGMKRNINTLSKHPRIDTRNHRDAVRIARRVIFEDGKPVAGVGVGNLLNDTSSVPIINAFSVLFNSTEIANNNYYDIFVVDVMHEFEIGVWKAAFYHLVQVLKRRGAILLSDLDKRFNQTPKFNDCIRHLHDHVSSLKQLTAHEFEDILQCAIPAFEGLFPDRENKIILDLLFCFAAWHGLAKLRMHTDSSVELLEQATRSLGAQIRLFKKEICGPIEQLNTEVKVYNLKTFKLHSLGHYASDIREVGTTDSYTTQTGELEHKLIKRRFGATNYKNIAEQMTIAERRARILSAIKEGASSSQLTGPSKKARDNSDRQVLNDMDAKDHYKLARDGKKVNLQPWVNGGESKGDPAFTASKALLGRIRVR